jgi:hypothetical protein
LGNTMYAAAPPYYQAQENKIIYAKTNGFGLVLVGLVLGLIQALLTIPYGGGYLILVVPASIMGLLGFILVKTKNRLSKNVGTGALVAAVLCVVSFLLCIVQIGIASSVMNNLNSNSVNLGDAINGLLIFILLLATATALLAISVAIPPIAGKANNWTLMLVPLILGVLAIVLAFTLSYINLSHFTSGTVTVNDAILGSQVGGILNFIALLSATILSFVVKVDVEPATGTYPQMYMVLPMQQAPYQPQPVQYAAYQTAPQYSAQPQQYPAPLPYAQPTQYSPQPMPKSICPTCGSQLSSGYCYRCQRYV